MKKICFLYSQRCILFLIFQCGCQQPIQTVQSAPDVPPHKITPKIQYAPPKQIEIEKSPYWKGDIETPIWAWKDKRGRVFLSFYWRITYLGADQDTMVPANRQKWSIKSDQGTFRVSNHPKNILAGYSSGKEQKAMFYTEKSKNIPSWVHVQYSVFKKSVLTIQQEVVEILTTGLSYTLEEKGKHSFYRGRKHEGSAELIHIRFKAHNNTDSPIVFSPFQWSSKQGRTKWKYHHKSSIREFIVVQPNDNIQGTIVLFAEKGSKMNQKVMIQYQGEDLGSIVLEK